MSERIKNVAALLKYILFHCGLFCFAVNNIYLVCITLQQRSVIKIGNDYGWENKHKGKPKFNSQQIALSVRHKRKYIFRDNV